MNELLINVVDLCFAAQRTDDNIYACSVRDTSAFDEEEPKFKQFNASAAEVKATAYLLITGEEDSEAAIQAYEVIGRLYDSFPRNLRPIP